MVPPPQEDQALERRQPDVPDVLSLLMLLSSVLGWMGQGLEALVMSAGCPGGDHPPPSSLLPHHYRAADQSVVPSSGFLSSISSLVIL